MFRLIRSVPATRMSRGNFIVMNTCRPPRSEPAVSKVAPDTSASVFKNSVCASFCNG